MNIWLNIYLKGSTIGGVNVFVDIDFKKKIKHKCFKNDTLSQIKNWSREKSIGCQHERIMTSKGIQLIMWTKTSSPFVFLLYIYLMKWLSTIMVFTKKKNNDIEWSKPLASANLSSNPLWLSPDQPIRDVFSLEFCHLYTCVCV